MVKVKLVSGISQGKPGDDVEITVDHEAVRFAQAGTRGHRWNYRLPLRDLAETQISRPQASQDTAAPPPAPEKSGFLSGLFGGRKAAKPVSPGLVATATEDGMPRMEIHTRLNGPQRLIVVEAYTRYLQQLERDLVIARSAARG